MKKLLAFLVACLLPICVIAGSGDVNGDGKVNVADIVELLNHLNGKATKNYQASEADVNNDGNVDLEDVDAIANRIFATKTDGTISLPDGVDNSFLKSCKIVGLNQNYEIEGNTFQIYTNSNGVVETFFLSDDEKTYMACRLSKIENVNEISIDVETSAIALATLHPLFAPLKGDDYNTIVSKIENSPKYLAFYQEVEKIIKDNNDLFDKSNEALINSLEELYDDILSDIDFDAYQNATATSLSRGKTRGISEHLDPTYTIWHINGNTLTLQCVGLTPSYYGTVTSAMTGEVREFIVRSRQEYGLMDLFLPYDQFHNGPECSFTFTTEGEHYISLSRTNAAATADFYLRLANTILNIIGIDLGNETVIQEIATTISNALLDVGMINVESNVLGDDVGFMDWFGVAYSATVDYFSRDTNYFVRRGLLGNIGNFAKILKGALDIYGHCKGIVNSGVKLAYAIDIAAPETIELCLCYYNGNLYECVEATLTKAGGDGQKGKANEVLKMPLRVYVQTIDHDNFYQKPSPFLKTKFEVVSGGGSVQPGFAAFNNISIADTYWTLGSSGEQIVEAVVWDLIEDCAVSDPVQFSASLLKKDEEPEEDDDYDFLYYRTCPDDNHPHWIDLGLPSGTLWRCCNAGASNPGGIGNCFYESNFIVKNAPSREQYNELISYTSSSLTTQGGIYGRIFIGRNRGSIFIPNKSCGWNSGVLWTSSKQYVPDLHRFYQTVFWAERLEFGIIGPTDTSVRQVSYK